MSDRLDPPQAIVDSATQRHTAITGRACGAAVVVFRLPWDTCVQHTS